MTDGNQPTPTPQQLINLRPPSTPTLLPGDSSRGLEAVTYHPIHGHLQSAPTISLKHQKVLEEDEYMEALSSIIKRDFFPSLDQFDQQRQRWIDERERRLRLIHLTAGTSAPDPSLGQPLQSSSTTVAGISWNGTKPGKSHRWEDDGPTPRPGPGT